MGAQQIIACAPFRLAHPRKLTVYEWSVVTGHVAAGYNAAGVFAGQPHIQLEIGALVQAIAQDAIACPNWGTSVFGPPPAVNGFAYQCLAAWFAPMDSASKMRALADIRGGGLLCSPNPPWGDCSAIKQGYGKFGAAMWEGSSQAGLLVPGAEGCAPMRTRTSYIPMKGSELLALFKTLGGQLPPQLAQAAQFGAQFVQRDFLVGVELRPTPLASIPALQTNADLLGLARSIVEDIALIWAPGKGESVRFLLDENLDASKIVALFTRMMPDLLGEIVPGLPGLLPGLLPPATDPIWTTIFTTVGQVMVPTQGFGAIDASASSPHTPPTTGSDVVDRVGTSLSTEPPPIQAPKSKLVIAGALAVAAVVAYGVARTFG